MNLSSNEGSVRGFFRYWAQPGCRKMIGESLREVGVLLLVFVPLDGILRQVSPESNSISTRFLGWLNVLGKINLEIAMFALGGFILIVLGIRIEHEAELALTHLNNRGESNAGTHDRV